MSKIIPTASKHKCATSELASSFIRKTYDILQDNKYPDAISWNKEGNALIIHKPEEFASKVLPAYFKHSQVTSFVRQLNLYNFHKLKAHKEDQMYQHELFQKGKRHLLKGIKRRTQGLNFESFQKSIETMQPSTSSVVDRSAISYENRLLRNFQKDTASRIDSLEAHVKNLTIQNQALYNEVNHQEEREDVLKEFINKILIAYDTPVEELDSFIASKGTSVNSKSRKKHSVIKEGDCTSCVSIRCLLQTEEDSPDSTEAGSHASPQRSEGGSKAEKNIDLTESLPIIGDLLAKISEKMKEQGEDSREIESRESQELWGNGSGWSLETNYLRKLDVLHQNFDEPFLTKNNLEGQDVLAKRSFLEFSSKIESVRQTEDDGFFIKDSYVEEEHTRKILHGNHNESSLLSNEKDFAN